MTHTEWAGLMASAGFILFASMVGYTLLVYIRTDSVFNLRQLVVGSGLFIVLIGFTRVVAQMAAPPFEIISGSVALEINAFLVWCMAILYTVGLTRRRV